MMAAIASMKDDWTPAKLAQHQAWRSRMYAPEKPAPKPDPLAVKLEIVADPDKAALEGKVQDLETMLGILREELIAVKKRRCMSIEALGTEAVIKLEEIIKTVAKYYGISVGELKSARRTSELARIRQVGMYLCKQLTLRSLPEIGRHFGGRDHTTILHGTRKIAALMLTDPVLCQEVVELESLFA
jgi:hypothetical protein